MLSVRVLSGSQQPVKSGSADRCGPQSIRPGLLFRHARGSGTVTLTHALCNAQATRCVVMIAACPTVARASDVLIRLMAATFLSNHTALTITHRHGTVTSWGHVQVCRTVAAMSRSQLTEGDVGIGAVSEGWPHAHSPLTVLEELKDLLLRHPRM